MNFECGLSFSKLILLIITWLLSYFYDMFLFLFHLSSYNSNKKWSHKISSPKDFIMHLEMGVFFFNSLHLRILWSPLLSHKFCSWSYVNRIFFCFCPNCDFTYLNLLYMSFCKYQTTWWWKKIIIRKVLSCTYRKLSLN